MRNEIAISELHNLMRYDPDTGLLYWKPRLREMFERERTYRMWNTRYAGAVALTANDSFGYLHGAISGVKVKAHRVAWALHTNEWPVNDLDHINGVRTDNRITNLREVDAAENAKNQKLHTSNTSGVPGVYWSKDAQKWRAQIDVDGTRKYLGYFRHKPDAIAARETAMTEAGYHENHGKR